MGTHSENIYCLALVNVGAVANVKRRERPKIMDMIAKRLEGLPTSCEYSGLLYSPPGSHGEVLECELLLGFSSEEEWKDWVSQLFDDQIDKPMDRLPDVIEAICEGNMDNYRGWALKLVEMNNVQPDAIETPTKFFDSFIKGWHCGESDRGRFILSCNEKFDKGCGVEGKRLHGKGLPKK